MKKSLYLFLLSAAVTFAVACGGHSHDHTHQHGATTVKTDSTGAQQTAAVYQCPMKCEGDKTYSEPGTCPVCKMDLALVKE